MAAAFGAPGIISSPYAGAAGFAPAIGFPQATGLSVPAGLGPGALGPLTNHLLCCHWKDGHAWDWWDTRELSSARHQS